MKRNAILIVLALVALGAGTLVVIPSCGPSVVNDGRRVFVLGCDGMDPEIATDLMDRGLLPNFAKLRDRGTYMKLGTSTPPQSPVAWSNFLTGSDARVHNIFDFIHRKPNDRYVDKASGKEKGKITPYLSTTETVKPETWFTLGDIQVPKPWAAGGLKNLVKGTPFWNYLTKAGVPTVIFRLPANYPPAKSKGAPYCCLSGMGVPDLRGTYGEFGLYSTDETLTRRRPEKHVSGGAFYGLGATVNVEHEPTRAELATLTSRLREKLHYDKDTKTLGIVGRMTTSNRGDLRSLFKSKADEKALDELQQKSRDLVSADEWTGWLIGPPNDTFKPDANDDVPVLEASFRVARDPEHDVASVELQDQVAVLQRGEWSDWMKVSFKTSAITPSLGGIVRFYLLEVHPDIRLYVTPLNIDPEAPAMEISKPASYAEDVAEETGLYYTLGIPEDHSALSEHALDDAEYLTQAKAVLDERLEQLDFTLERFDNGFLFFYFGSTDQVAHMFWRHIDPRHPLYDPEEAAKYGKVLEDVYINMDRALGKILKHLDDNDTIIVMSDHGFTTFRYGFNLNSWLRDNGYLAVTSPMPGGKDNLFINTDWSKTKAYGFGINCLYVNLKGREFGGIVNKGAEYDQLLDDVSKGLLSVTDPNTGQHVIADVYRVDKLFPGADPNVAPDLLIGYADTYRASWETVLGEMTEELISDNTNLWSGDHCVATDIVPGVIFSNRKITVADPNLCDLAPTILMEFGVTPPKTMLGRPLFGSSKGSV